MEGGTATGQLLGGAISLADILFYLLALLAIAGGAGVAFSRNIVYSAFSLLAALFAVAGIYIFVSADLVAVVQVLVYIGGILVLILFAIMLTSKIGDARSSNLNIGMGPGLTVFALLLTLTVFIAAMTPWGRIAGEGLPALLTDPALQPTSARIGDLLLTDFLLPFEIASVVLLAAIIGAVVIARKEMRVVTPHDEQEHKS